MMTTWRIYYADDTCYQGDPFTAPARGVVVITQPEPNTKGWRTVTGDYYVLQPWGWEGVDQSGLWDYLMEPGPRKVLFGRTIPTNDFERIWARARREA